MFVAPFAVSVASGFPRVPLLLRWRQRGQSVSDIFISYSRDNQEAVRHLAEAVKALGYDVWWDDQLPPHLAYGDVIAQKVGGAKAAIVVWSANAAASEWVRAEADMARSQKKLIQTTIDGAEPPMPFNQLHYVSLADWQGQPDHPGWAKVRESLAALAGDPSGGAAAAPPAPAAPTPEAPTVSPAAAGIAAGAAAGAAAVAAVAPPPVVPEPVPAAPEPEPVSVAPPAPEPVTAPPPAPTPPAPVVPPVPAPTPPPAAPVPPPVPAAVAAPPPPPPPPAPGAPTPRGKGGNKVLIIIIVLAVLILGTVGVLAWLKSREGQPPAGNDVNAVGPVENNTGPAADENFSQEAVLQGDDEFANVRSGPAADAPIVARINAGEPFNTYQQDGVWWRVRINGGLVGYIERARVRLRDPVGVPPLEQPAGNDTAPAPGNDVAPVPGNQVAPVPPPTNQQTQQQQQRPRPRPQDTRRPRPDPRLNRENSGVMFDYCKGAGAGTRQCRALGLSR